MDRNAECGQKYMYIYYTFMHKSTNMGKDMHVHTSFVNFCKIHDI